MRPQGWFIALLVSRQCPHVHTHVRRAGCRGVGSGGLKGSGSQNSSRMTAGSNLPGVAKTFSMSVRCCEDILYVR
eukprot:364995-Chlamydomonas_euryale.AAC.3